jgi:hypothetical protein
VQESQSHPQDDVVVSRRQLAKRDGPAIYGFHRNTLRSFWHRWRPALAGPIPR